jgi:hypothetical protein
VTRAGIVSLAYAVGDKNSIHSRSNVGQVLAREQSGDAINRGLARQSRLPKFALAPGDGAPGE